MVDEGRENLCYSRSRWQHYDAGVWTPLEGKEGYKRPYDIVRAAADAGEFSYSWRLVNEVSNGAGVELSKPDDIWDRHAHKLAFTNVTLNLETYKSDPHSPENYITAGVPYAFDPEARGPHWDRYIRYLSEHEDVGTEVVEFLQEYLGYCLTADASAEIMLFLVGRRGSGKSTFIEGAEAMLGRDLIMTQSMAGLSERFGRAGIVGKRLILSKEMSALKLLETDAVSNIVSGERVRIEHKGVDGYDYTPVAKIIQAANDLPRVPNTEAGIYRRLQVIKFPDLECSPDPTLKEGIKAEGPYILNWAIKGLRRMQERGGFEIPTKVKHNSAVWRDENNVVKMFLDECLKDGEETIRTTEIHKLYNRWCDQHQYKALALGEFAKRAKREVFFVAHARKHRNVSMLADIDLTDEGHAVNKAGYEPAIDFAGL